MKKRYKFDLQQFLKAISLLVLSICLNLIPLIYAFLNDKYINACEYVGFEHWIVSNSEIYVLLLSTVFTSFIEYIMTMKNIINGLIFFNVIYVLLLSAVWGIVELRVDLINEIMKDVSLETFLIVLVVCAVSFCFVNLLLMNLRGSTDTKEIYRRKKII